MAITPVQLNIENAKIRPSFKGKNGYESYLNQDGHITTENYIKPLPPKGHLIDDTPSSSVKYFFKDIGYDMMSLKNGYKGTANDHQLGRLNDVGLRLGGIGIATYLASVTNNPKARLMEYIGLGTFLAMMSLYPKLFINEPARIIHGYDVDKQYIDDQGRKKSVQQDSNYVPYDMYLGEKKDEDFDFIGDKMGIPRDIKNRNDVIREQMRKIATQNNTLWMLTAGFAIPILTAITCCGLENYVVAPAIAKAKNSKADMNITEALRKLEGLFAENVKDARENSLSKSINRIAASYKNQELPLEEFDNISNKITEGLSDKTTRILKKELSDLLTPESKKSAEEILEASKALVRTPAQRNVMLPSKSELEKLMSEVLAETNGVDSAAAENTFVQKVRGLINSKIIGSSLSAAEKDACNTQTERLVNGLLEGFRTNNTGVITKEKLNKLGELTKIIGEFKENDIILDKCRHFKFEADSETILARAASKFENTFIKELGITYKDLRKMKDSSEYTKKILDGKLAEIAKDKEKFKNLIEKLAKVVSDTDVAINGYKNDLPIKNLISAYEYLYNGTAQRLEKLGGFAGTMKAIAGADADLSELKIQNIEDLTRFLDGTTRAISSGDLVRYAQEHGKDLGSDKHLAISRIYNRYQDSINTYNRVIHTADAYKRLFADGNLPKELSSKDSEYIKTVLEKCRETLLKANSSEHFNKLYTVNAGDLYKDVMTMLYELSPEDKFKGVISEDTKSVLKKYNSPEKGNLLSRFEGFIAKFRNIIGNDKTEFTKELTHNFDNMSEAYSRIAQTEAAKANLAGLQNMTEYIKNAAGRRYNTNKWLRTMFGIAGVTIAAALSAQFAFGKIRNPHNIKKQVKNEQN